MSALAERLISPLDRWRSAVMRRALDVAPLRALLVRKARRIPVLLLAHAALAFALSVLAPTWLLVVGPLLLGVPHLVSDVRELVLRPSLPRRTRTVFLLGCALLLGLRAVETTSHADLGRVELALAGAWLLIAIKLGFDRAAPGRAAIATLLALGLSSCAIAWPAPARLLLGHAHNVLALALWGYLFARSSRAVAVVLVVVLALALALVLTPLAWLGFRHGAPALFGLHSLAAADSLAPGVANVDRALGIVASFAFLQSVHYAVWLHAIPQEATRSEGTTTFRMTWRALQAELGRWALGPVAGAVLLIPLVGLAAPLATKSFYLSLSAFHGYLELAALAFFFVRRARPA